MNEDLRLRLLESSIADKFIFDIQPTAREHVVEFTSAINYICISQYFIQDCDWNAIDQDKNK